VAALQVLQLPALTPQQPPRRQRQQPLLCMLCACVLVSVLPAPSPHAALAASDASLPPARFHKAAHLHWSMTDAGSHLEAITPLATCSAACHRHIFEEIYQRSAEHHCHKCCFGAQWLSSMTACRTSRRASSGAPLSRTASSAANAAPQTGHALLPTCGPQMRHLLLSGTM
jgi:hypothetical protein